MGWDKKFVVPSHPILSHPMGHLKCRIFFKMPNLFDYHWSTETINYYITLKKIKEFSRTDWKGSADIHKCPNKSKVPKKEKNSRSFWKVLDFIHFQNHLLQNLFWFRWKIQNLLEFSLGPCWFGLNPKRFWIFRRNQKKVLQERVLEVGKTQKLPKTSGKIFFLLLELSTIWTLLYICRPL